MYDRQDLGGSSVLIAPRHGGLLSWNECAIRRQGIDVQAIEVIGAAIGFPTPENG